MGHPMHGLDLCMGHPPPGGTLFRMRKILMLAFFISAPAFAQNQDKSKIAVKVLCSTSDDIGKRVCTATRDQIAASPRFRLEESPKNKIATYEIHVVSVEISPGLSTAFSAVFTLGTYYLTSTVQTCGSSVVEGCVKDIIATLDDKIHGN
jgi:hypothetical protein